MFQNYQTKLDRLYKWFFIIHIPITILIDSSLVIPKDRLFSFQRDLLEFHISTNRDFLLENVPLWLKVFGYIEIFVQLPFFFYGSVALHKKSESVSPYMIMYGLNASLSTIVCLAYVAVEGEAHGLSLPDIIKLLMIYLPYLVLPGVMALDYTERTTQSLKYSLQIKKTI